MQRRELVFRHAPSSFAASEEYVFKHALLRDVTYETVLLRLRKRFHAQVALWMEANAGERMAEYLGLVGHHYELAGESAKAARYLRKQANNLQRTSAARDALVLYRRALALCPEADKRQRAVIHTHIGNSLRQLSEHHESREHHRQAIQLARETGDSQAEINALEGLSWALMGQGLYDEARKHLERALALAYQANDQRGKAQVLLRMGEVTYRLGDSRATEAYAAECLAINQQLQDRQGIAGALRILGFSHFMREQYAESYHYQTQSKSVYAQIGDRWGVGTGLVNQGEALRRQRRFAEAEGCYLEASAILREIGNRLGDAITMVNLGHVQSELDHDAQARDFYLQAIGQSLAIETYSILLESFVGIARLEARSGRHAYAAELLGMVQAHHEYNDEIRANSLPALSLLQQHLDQAELAAALERGRALDIGQVTQSLLTAKGTA
jgi:tetratricopeptide (TPR) repeat protein